MTEPAQTRRAVVETLVGTFIFTMIWALLLNAVLELFHSGGDLKQLIGYNLYRRFPIFALSAMVIWAVLLLVLALTGRLWATCAGLLAVALVIGMVDRVKVRLRMEPVYPSDIDFLKSPGFLFSMVSPWQLILGLVVLALVVAAVIRFGRVPTRTFKPVRRRATPRAWWALVGIRVVAGVLCLAMLAYAGSFNDRGNKLRLAFEDEGVQWAFWYQNLNYLKNGFVPGLLYNLLSDAMVEPDDYSKATMQDIVARWTREADLMNRSRKADLSGVNVVSVLSEAFSDPTTIKGATVEGDPIPFTRSLMQHTTSGKMLAQLFGGGTANMEFETLTGQSLAEFEPQMNTPYQQFVHDDTDYPTIVGYMHEHGHRAIAIHPYMTAMYQRKDVYRAFGFDDFIHDTTMHFTKKIDDNEFISDEAAFKEVTRQIDDTAEPLFVNLITMQNHYPMADKYDDPWPVSNVKGNLKNELSGYSRGINYTDQALRAMLERLSASKEKTAVIFYGDHLPAFWPDDVYKQNGDPAMKSTPFFIWTNFKTPKLDTAPLTSPIYFLPLLFEQLDAKVPPYYALLTRMYAKVSAMEQGVKYGPDGQPVVEDAETRQLLHDYRLIQYDLSIGKRYSQSGLFYPPAVGDAASVQTQGKR